MAVAKKSADKKPAAEDSIAPRARMHKLTIRNFRAIGKQPVEIELDDIVVLVGANNTGKSSILRAYQLVMESGAKGELLPEDFHGGYAPGIEVTDDDLPSIELETVLFKDSKAPADKWIDSRPNGDRHVRERWTWRNPGKPEKRGFDFQLGSWDKDHGPWGVASVAQANRPEMHRIEAFDDPKKQADSVISLLEEATKQRVKALTEEEGKDGAYAKLLDGVAELQKTVANEAMQAIEAVRLELGGAMADVFPGYSITLDARPEDDLSKSISFFKAPPVLRMGPADGHQSDLERQGSGTRRTLMWNALRIIADHKAGAKGTDRPHVLLLDEPELCLHPAAVRDACNVLYSLPDRNSWQVMVTTHSPAFIDLSRNNTSIVRVERSQAGAVSGTTIFRPARANLSEEDKERLKLLNMYDPYVAEFFFGGRTVIVEGDTEYAAFREVIADDPGRFRDVHIVRARGKYTIIALCKILNQFGCPYSVLHDADLQRVKNNKGGLSANSAWPANRQILEEVRKSPSNVRLAASLHTFEVAMFGELLSGEKPYASWLRVRKDGAAREKVLKLLDFLARNSEDCPDGVLQWEDEDALSQAVAHFEPKEQKAAEAT
ncbi:ATP-dependent nuclease [Pseudoxanthomonas winnipegensis]|uniref:ATP-dependent nuclease n=1 Tax=Pseudoxanthomonas winnipegensis TaxID=2480810 RepID=UPI0030F39D90